MLTHRVFGAGLVGGFLTGALLASGQPVTVVARPRVREKLADGLTLTDLEGHRADVPPPRFLAASPATEDRAPDLLWLTVKCTSVEAAIPDLAEHLGPDTIIVCCQNGLGSEGPVRAAFPGHLVLKGMVAFNVAELADSHLHRGSGGPLTVEAHPRVSGLPELITTPLITLELSDDIDAVLWAKLQLNLVNAINALSDVPVREMLQQRGYRRVFAACMRELLDVTRSLGLDLPRLTALPARWIPGLLEQPDWLFRRLARPMLEVDPTVRTSMWWDLTKGRRTEIEFLNGALVAVAADRGIATPVNSRIVELVHAAERGELEVGVSADELAARAGLS
jgi:2-dehydropantoate 2-reductase